MPQVKQRNKIKPHELEKIRARYYKKREEFKAMSFEELHEAVKKRMSFTDRCAANDALKAKKDELLKANVQEETNGTNAEPDDAN